MQAIQQSKKEILITTSYFIPGETIVDALVVAALSGVKVKILVPGNSDSIIVNAAAFSYYDDLLEAGVEIFLYEKGFVHSKTLVADEKLAMVGTANMDYRSFELNFEVNALVYDEVLAKELKNVFDDDIKHSKKIDPKEWPSRPLLKQFGERCARLISPFL